jgi:hypothetical protein
VEETRQYSALKALYLLWVACCAAALVLLIVIIFAKLPTAGTAMVLLLFAGFLSRTAFQWAAFVSLISARNRRRIALNTVVWSLMTTAFFVFVILYHFGIRA